MNKKLIVRVLGVIMLIEAVCMMPALIIAIAHREPSWSALLISMLICTACGLPMQLLEKPRTANLRAREGFMIDTLAWLIMSLFGAVVILHPCETGGAYVGAPFAATDTNKTTSVCFCSFIIVAERVIHCGQKAVTKHAHFFNTRPLVYGLAAQILSESIW